MSTAFIFPGQGSQYPGMLHDLLKYTVMKECMEEAGMVLEEDVFTMDTESTLKSTRSVQLCLLIYGVCAARILMSEGAMPDMVSGHSVGAFAAAVISGALDFSNALRIVAFRGSLMQNSFPTGYGMGVVTGLDVGRTALLTEKVNTESKPVFLANLNAQDQTTIAGSLEAIQKVFALARLEGIRTAKLLNVSVPSHCTLLDSVSLELSSKMQSITMSDSVIPYIGICRARVLRKAEQIRDDLSKGVANPVRWQDATALMFELGTRLYVEPGPGETLTNLAKQAFPEARCISAMNSGVDSAILLMNKEKDRQS